MSIQYDDDDDDDCDRQQQMIDWLSDKTADVWFDVSTSLNWGTSVRVLDWIVSQPMCDRANAAFVFWGCDPSYHVRNPRSEHIGAESRNLMEKILGNWKSGFYGRGELTWNDRGIPDDLFGPIPGREPYVPKHLSKYYNEELRRLFWRLRTDIGHAPDSPEALEIARRLQRDQRKGFWGSIFRS